MVANAKKAIEKYLKPIMYHVAVFAFKIKKT